MNKEERKKTLLTLPIEILVDLVIAGDEIEERNAKAIEYNEHLIRDAKYHLNLGHLKKMRKILKGDSNEMD